MIVEGKRGPGRPPSRPVMPVDESVMENDIAAARTEGLRDAGIRPPNGIRAEGPRKVRPQEAQAGDLPVVYPPEGYDYNWKRIATINQPDDRNLALVARYHWTPVLTEMHPEAMPPGTDPKKPIIVGDVMLMMRESYLTDEAEQANIQKAKLQVEHKFRSLGESPDGTHEPARPNVKAEWKQMQRPDD